MMNHKFKVVCIDVNVKNQNEGHLTLNNVYDAENIPYNYFADSYYILCNDGEVRPKLSNRFVTLAEYRDIQLNNLLNE